MPFFQASTFNGCPKGYECSVAHGPGELHIQRPALHILRDRSISKDTHEAGQPYAGALSVPPSMEPWPGAGLGRPAVLRSANQLVGPPLAEDGAAQTIPVPHSPSAGEPYTGALAVPLSMEPWRRAGSGFPSGRPSQPDVGPPLAKDGAAQTIPPHSPSAAWPHAGAPGAPPQPQPGQAVLARPTGADRGSAGASWAPAGGGAARTIPAPPNPAAMLLAQVMSVTDHGSASPGRLRGWSGEPLEMGERFQKGNADAAVPEDLGQDDADAAVRRTKGRKRNAFFKMKLCEHYPMGTCAKGSRCQFAHGEEELLAAPNLQNTKLCPHVSAGNCPKGAKCKFAHSDGELRDRKGVLRAHIFQDLNEAPASSFGPQPSTTTGASGEDKERGCCMAVNEEDSQQDCAMVIKNSFIEFVPKVERAPRAASCPGWL